MRQVPRLFATTMAAFGAAVLVGGAAGPAATTPAPVPAQAPAAAAVAPYTETIPGTSVSFDMVPVPGGTFTMGSPASEPFHFEDEGPQVKVQVAPFWMGKLEVTWAEYDLYAFAKRPVATPGGATPTGADAVSR